jgi:DnaK suppressor protein
MAKSSAKKIAKPAAKAVTKKSAPAKASARKPTPKLVKKAAPAVKSPVAKSASKPVSKPVATKTASKPAAKPAAKAVTKTVAAPKPAPKPKRVYKPAKLPAGYKPTASEPYMNPQQEEYFRQKLLGWRKSLMDESRETLDHLHEENWHQADIADRASLETEAGVELRTRNRYLKLISKIDQAINRIEQGDYGFCEETGEPIGLKRLEARPVATLSIEAQERHEKIEKQYTDED